MVHYASRSPFLQTVLAFWLSMADSVIVGPRFSSREPLRNERYRQADEEHVNDEPANQTVPVERALFHHRQRHHPVRHDEVNGDAVERSDDKRIRNYRRENSRKHIETDRDSECDAEVEQKSERDARSSAVKRLLPQDRA